ncbi:lasso peptide biosynthesis B2 protein [Phytoactinopolyspora mesophila]|uniref:Lasso peptide biosynthesis B2 protein n=1 Tax=Phytoactinopolyspora mesophila TaxID=2650750 RepID=A0A7K3MAA5_9ACTN|nr:lasso peptide biosynthesis B2 protein [Phytoactinopolyspora mesophila]NDL60224.1 lasso peptide biosynthesis B2 protein [Phytoactinopolyspora mesophila]
MALEASDRRQLQRRSDQLLAPLCLSLACMILQLRFGRVLALARWTSRRCRRPATVSEAASMTAAVRSAARHRAGRVACLEYSLATVLLAGLHRQSVQWCIGARLMPYGSHAWIELNGCPVGEPEHRDRPYNVLVRI